MSVPPTARRRASTPDSHSPGTRRERTDRLLLSPLFAMLFRPLALLPIELAAAIWGTIVLLSFLATLCCSESAPRDVARRRRLGVPIGFTLAVARRRPWSRYSSRSEAHSGSPWPPTSALPAPRGVWFVGQCAGVACVPLPFGPRAWSQSRVCWSSRRPWTTCGRSGSAGLVDISSRPTQSHRCSGPCSLAAGCSPCVWLQRAGARRLPSAWRRSPSRLPIYILMGLLAALRPDRLKRGDASAPADVQAAAASSRA